MKLCYLICEIVIRCTRVKLIYILAILMKLLRYKVLLRIILRYLQDNLSSPEVNELLHLVIKLLNSSSKNGVHFVISVKNAKSELSCFYFLSYFYFLFNLFSYFSIFRTRVRVRVTRSCCYTASHIR